MKYAKILLLPLLLCYSLVAAHDQIPQPAETSPQMLANGTIYTVSGEVLENTDLLIENGRISQIGRSLSAPAGCKIIDMTGMNIYPGIIAPATTLGLTEIGAVRATNDVSERGSITPEVKTHIAYNPDSELLPTVRAAGITTVQVIPGGSLLRGQSSIMHLDGWTKEDAAVRLVDGIHLSWPSTSISNAWWERRTPEKQREDMKKARQNLKEAFDNARAYSQAKQADPSTPVDLRWEAMTPLFSKDMPLFVHANDYRQIEQAVSFFSEIGLRMILVGGAESWKLTDLLKKHDIPVIYGSVHSMPMRSDDSYDMKYRIPGILQKGGVRFCLTTFGSWGARNLPFQAGQTVSFGLDKANALRAITLSAAEILGIDNDYGSIDIGKSATLIAVRGDLLDYSRSEVEKMFIDGRPIDLDSKQKELFRKYQKKHFVPQN